MKLRNKKTGRTHTLSEDLYIEYTQGGRIEARIVLNGGYMSYYYNSLAELNADWEDVEESLIKDEKIRKAVRAWAEANDLDGASFYTSSHFWYLRAFNHREQGIDFWLKWDDKPNLIESKYYTIEELCGEEEKC